MVNYCVVSDLKRSWPAVSQIWIWTLILSCGTSNNLLLNSTPIVDEISFGGFWFLINQWTNAVFPTLASPTRTTKRLKLV
jgi:hypothetical protein